MFGRNYNISIFIIGTGIIGQGDSKGAPRLLICHLAVNHIGTEQENFLFDLILYVPVNNLSITSGRVFLGWSSTKLG